MRDANCLLLAGGTVVTGTGNGPWLDLGIGTTQEKNGLAAANLIGPRAVLGMNEMKIPISAIGTAGTVTFTIQSADDTAGTVTNSGSVAATATQEYTIPYEPLRRFVRLGYVAGTGNFTIGPAGAVVGSRAI